MDSSGGQQSRAHLYREFTHRFEKARDEKNGLLRYMSQLSGQISHSRRILGERERERSTVAFRRPITTDGQQYLDWLEQDIRRLGRNIRQIEESKATVEVGIREAEADMVAARNHLDDELAKLE